MLKYYFSKGFVVLERNSNHLKIIDNEDKQIIHKMDMHYSYYVITCTTANISISKTLNKLLLQYDLHSSCNQYIYNGEEEIIHNIFSKYF